MRVRVAVAVEVLAVVERRLLLPRQQLRRQLRCCRRLRDATVTPPVVRLVGPSYHRTWESQPRRPRVPAVITSSPHPRAAAVVEVVAVGEVGWCGVPTAATVAVSVHPEARAALLPRTLRLQTRPPPPLAEVMVCTVALESHARVVLQVATSSSSAVAVASAGVEGMSVAVATPSPRSRGCPSRLRPQRRLQRLPSFLAAVAQREWVVGP